MLNSTDGTFQVPSTIALGPDLAPSVPAIELTEETSTKLAHLFQACPSPYDEPEECLVMLKKVPALLPQNMLSMIHRFKLDPGAPGAMCVFRLPQDAELPRTPAQGQRSMDKRSYVSECGVLGFAQLLGEPIGFRDEKQGQLIHNVCPVGGKEYATSNEGSLGAFHFHRECAYFEFGPDFLLLSCLRTSDPPAVTCVADVRDACRLVDPEVLAVLRKPIFQIRAPESFHERHGCVLWSASRPVLSGPEEAPELRVDFNGMRAPDPQARAALETLQRALEHPSVTRDVRLLPGMMVLINNRKTVHGRRPFAPRHDGADRWLQRIYVRLDLWPGRAGAAMSRIF